MTPVSKEQHPQQVSTWHIVTDTLFTPQVLTTGSYNRSSQQVFTTGPHNVLPGTSSPTLRPQQRSRQQLLLQLLFIRRHIHSTRDLIDTDTFHGL